VKEAEQRAAQRHEQEDQRRAQGIEQQHGHERRGNQ
jgi:hypothetical protein